MIRFLPAHLPGTFEGVMWDGKPISWWEKDNPFFTYPYLLVSAYHGIESKWRREENVKNKDAYVVADSGGFQNVTLQANLEPIKVLKWQEDNCDLGFVLEQPPFEYTGGKVEKNIVSMEKFKSCVDISKNNVSMMQKYRGDGKCKIYNILHGHNIERMDIWWNELSQYQFDGWATGGVKPVGDPLRQVLRPLYLYDKGITKNIHMLGMSGYDVMPTLVYLSKYIDNLTFDSSTYSEGRRYSVFRMPFSPKMRVPFGGREKVNPIWKEIGMEKLKLDTLPCSCNVCEKLKNNVDMNIFYDGMNTLGSSLLSLHNLKIQLDFVETLKSLVKSDYLYKEFIKSNIETGLERVYDSFGFIDMAVEEGFEKAYRKYESKLDIKDNTDKTSSLYQY